MKEEETILTERQKEVLKLRNEGYSQEEIAKKFGQTKQNISAIERGARANVKKAENTIEFIKLLKAWVWFSVEENADLDEVIGKIYSEADKAKIHIAYDGLTLATKIREELMDKMRHRRIIRKFEVGITKEGEIILL
jgi:Tfx family DNA-binding protein